MGNSIARVMARPSAGQQVARAKVRAATGGNMSDLPQEGPELASQQAKAATARWRRVDPQEKSDKMRAVRMGITAKSAGARSSRKSAG